MKIECSINSIWAAEVKKQSGYNYQELDTVLDKAWHKNLPAFVENIPTQEELLIFQKWAAHLHNQGIKNLIVIGIGGSSLGAKAIQHFSLDYSNNLVFWEGTHPSILRRYSIILERKGVAILWISKSGTTLESRVNLSLAREFFTGVPEYFITSYPDKIADLCTDSSRIFTFPESLGGRYSVCSAVGLVPISFINGSIEKFVKGYQDGNQSFGINVASCENHAKKMAHDLFLLLSQDKYNNVIFWVYAHELKMWGLWLVQLWGESLGKSIEIKAMPHIAKGPEDQHSMLQYFMATAPDAIHIFTHTQSYDPINTILIGATNTYLENHNLWEIIQAQMLSIEMALTDKGIPVCEYVFPNLYQETLGKATEDLCN